MIFALLAVLAASLAAAGVSAAATTTVRVDEQGDAGWTFNPDPVNATDYEFSLNAKSIGTGSLYVFPLSATNGPAKFVALKQINTPVSDLASLSYDFQVATAGVAANPYKHFYLNAYTNLPGSSTFYDCRFDYVPTSGPTGSFTPMSITPATAPTTVGDRVDAFTCPTTLGGMPAGSTVRDFALNVGDTGLNDAGVSGYLDNVGVSTSNGNTTVYDFEVRPAVKDACKDGGWASYGFANQGKCVSYLQAADGSLK